MGKRLKRGASKGSKIYGIVTLIIIVGAVLGFIWAQTGLLLVNDITYSSFNLPRQYSGYKIAHVSNIDNERQHVASKIKSDKPDLIVVSGGLVDAKGKYNNTIKELNELEKIATTVFVAQEKDLDYIDEIISETDAAYFDGNELTLESKGLTAEEYVELHCDDGMLKEIEEGTDEAEKYMQYIEDELEKSKDEIIQIMGVNGFNENIYDTKDEIFAIQNFDSNYRILLFGNYKDSVNLNDSGLSIVLSGGTYGVKNSTKYTDGAMTVNGYQLFLSPGVCSDIPESRRFMNFAEVQMITLHDGMIYRRNLLERFIDIFMKDTGTIFDNDGGFTEHKYEYNSGVFEDVK